jgi:hypothetical protein
MLATCEHVEVGTGNITLAGGDRTFPAEHGMTCQLKTCGGGRDGISS